MKRSLTSILAVVVCLLGTWSSTPSGQEAPPTISSDLAAHARGNHTHRVIVQADSEGLGQLRRGLHGRVRRELENAIALEVSDGPTHLNVQTLTLVVGSVNTITSPYRLPDAPQFASNTQPWQILSSPQFGVLPLQPLTSIPMMHCTQVCDAVSHTLPFMFPAHIALDVHSPIGASIATMPECWQSTSAGWSSQ